MRVIAGRLGGQSFASPHGHRTHPMSDKMRGALFNALGDITGLTVLDAFAGSGALAIEAISRGAQQAVAVDIDKKANTALKDNMKKLKIDNHVQSIQASIYAWSGRQTQQFDLILADPPYNDIPLRDLTVLPKHLVSTGTLVLSWPGNQSPYEFQDLTIVQTKNYGDGQLVFYQKVR